MVNSGSAYGLDDLIDVDLSLSPNTGDVLKWDGDKFIAAAEGAFTPGGNYFIDIIDEEDNVILNASSGWFAGSIRSSNGAAILVDADNDRFYGDLYGDLYGNLTGDVFGDLTGNILGNLTGNVIGNVQGNLTGNVQGNLTGDVTGNVRADDSTVIVDAINNQFYGNLIGDVTGDVTGDLFGNVQGNVTGNLTGNVNGTVNGDLIGSVYSDDSTLVIDGTAGKAPLLVCDVANSLVNTTSAIVTDFIINQRILTDPARNPAMVISSETDGMFDGPFFQMIGYRGNAGIGQQPLQVGDTAGQIRFSSANFGLNENRPIPVILNTVITEVGNNVTTFTQGKLQVILLAGPDIMDASVTEITKGGVLSTPVLQTGVYADATARDAYFTDRSISPAAGMIVFLTGTSKFSGYNGSTWDNLN
jgi:hypothetical protein